MTKKDYLIFILCTKNKEWGNVFIGDEIWREHLWDFLVYPHQSKQKKTITYNKCIIDLPKLEYFTGPRIIYNSAQRLGYIPNRTTDNNKYLVKFIYKLNHSTHSVNSRILIIEYVLIDVKKTDTWEDFTKKAHAYYAERLLE